MFSEVKVPDLPPKLALTARFATRLTHIGFSKPCARTWFYNVKNTRRACLGTCLLALNVPYLKQDGSLNDCIQCYEDSSGPVFKAVSGRTRRNSGIPSALCRPCETVAPLVHEYWR